MGTQQSRLSFLSSKDGAIMNRKMIILPTTILGLVAAKTWYNGHTILASIYNRMIVHMTQVWYRSVLERLDDNSTLLDVGIGTAGALLTCRDLIISKRIKIIGIDYNEYYIAAAKEDIRKAELQDYVHVECMSVYDTDRLCNEAISRKQVDAVYFSGSFSLLPDPMKALQSVSSDNILKKEGNIYITQTYQRRSPPFMTTFKPLMKYFTSVDFGQLITEEEIIAFHQQVVSTTSKTAIPLKLQQHSIIPNSLDNIWQAAYLTVYKRDVE